MQNISSWLSKRRRTPELDLSRVREIFYRAPELIEVEAVFGRILTFKGDMISTQISQFGAHTRPELAFLLTVIDPGDRVFDLGAHIGTFAIPIAKKVGTSGRVAAIEGDPEIFSVLLRNIERNHLISNVSLHNQVIAPPNFEVRHVKGNTGATYYTPGRSAPEHITYITVDRLVSKNFSPNVIKLDIEGIEGWAIINSSFIAEYKPILYTEVSVQQWRRFGTKVQDVDYFLREIGYRFFRNVGPRNAASDNFTVAELSSLVNGPEFYDLLALPQSSSRLARLV